jgi:hypothetical protein
MVPGSIADFLQASALLGGLAGFAGALWAAINEESTENDSRLWANGHAMGHKPWSGLGLGKALLGCRVGDQRGDGLGHYGTFLLQPGHDAEDLLALIQPKLLPGNLAFEETSLGPPGLFRVAEQRHEIAGGCEIPRAQGSFGRLLERPVLWFGHGDHLSAREPDPRGCVGLRGSSGG